MLTLRDMFTGNIPLGNTADPQYNKFSFNINGMPIDPSVMGMFPMSPQSGMNNLTATQKDMGKAQPTGQPSTSTAIGYSSPFPTSNNGMNLGYGSYLGNAPAGFGGYLSNAPAGGNMGFNGGLRQMMTRWA